MPEQWKVKDINGIERLIKRGLEQRYKDLMENISQKEWDIAMEDDPDLAVRQINDLGTVKYQLEYCYDKEAENERERKRVKL